MKTYFISGHRKITQLEFIKNYKESICRILQRGEKVEFVVGDYYGVDTMAQEILKEFKQDGINNFRLTVFHMFEKPRNNVGDWPTYGGFTTDEERDEAMTLASDEDIAWVNPKFIGKNSGTEQNINRRERIDRAIKNGEF